MTCTAKQDRPAASERLIVAIAIGLDHSEPWHQDCYQGVVDFGKEQDWLCVVDPFVQGIGVPPSLESYAGIVGRIDPPAAAAAKRARIPVVNHMNSTLAWDQLHNVICDPHACATLACDHLIARGYRRFATLGELSRRHVTRTRKAVIDRLQSLDYPSPEQIDLDWEFESARQGIANLRQTLTHWLSSHQSPVGAITVSSVLARYLAQICSELGLRIPQDVGIVAVGGDTALNYTASPTITAVQIDYRQVGYQAARTLQLLMQGKTVQPSNQLLPPSRLIPRQSTDIFLSADPLITQAMRWIADHCQTNLKVEDLAQAVGTSRRTIERSFEQHVGRSVHSEIRRFRTEHIKRLLVETNTPITTVAYNTGFESPSYFTQFFTREAGTSPSNYRKRHKG